MKHLTMSELEKLGFKVTKSYAHDEYMTQRRCKGCITVETTWTRLGEFVSQDLQIDDGEWRILKARDIVVLDKILNK